METNCNYMTLLPAIIYNHPCITGKINVKLIYRNPRRPIESKIGNFITTHERLLELYDQRRSIVMNGTLIPVSVVFNWQYSQIVRCLKNKYFKEYNKTMATTVPMLRFNSSQISYIGYDYNNNELYVTFKNTGKTYKYSDVPLKTYEELRDQGTSKYFNANIKGKYSFSVID